MSNAVGQSSREKIIVKTSIIGIVANVFLAAFKAAIGLMSNSIAITLDAVNIIIPKVESGEETENIMYWASYAPRGNRGFGATAVRAGR
ncbi:MAG: hypothetical protein IJU00_00220, partial [Selenomonas sp.]|nr:hypothetical protein [Selenomonas sp.]